MAYLMVYITNDITDTSNLIYLDMIFGWGKTRILPTNMDISWEKDMGYDCEMVGYIANVAEQCRWVSANSFPR